VSIAVIPLLAIRKTAMFTPSSLAYLGQHALLKSPRSAITSWKNGIPGMLLLLRKGLQEGALQFRRVFITGISRQHYIRFGRNTTSGCFDLLIGLSPVINGSSLLTLRQSHINLGDWSMRLESFHTFILHSFSYIKRNNFIVPYVFAQYCLALSDIGWWWVGNISVWLSSKEEF
jgi:hypothetical protein